MSKSYKSALQSDRPNVDHFTVFILFYYLVVACHFKMWILKMIDSDDENLIQDGLPNWTARA